MLHVFVIVLSKLSGFPLVYCAPVYLRMSAAVLTRLLLKMSGVFKHPGK
jgi:hypothetical protein